MGHDIFNNIADVLALARKFDEYFGEEYPRPVDAVFCLIFSVGQTNEAAGLIAICFPGEEEPDQKEVETLLKELYCNEGGLEIRGIIPLSHYEEVLAARKARQGQAKETLQLVHTDIMWHTPLTHLRGLNPAVVERANRHDYVTVWDVVRAGRAKVKEDLSLLGLPLFVHIQAFLATKATEVCARYGIKYVKTEDLGLTAPTLSLLHNHFMQSLGHMVLLGPTQRSVFFGEIFPRSKDALERCIAAMMPDGKEPENIMVSKTPAPETATPTPAQ